MPCKPAPSSSDWRRALNILNMMREARQQVEELFYGNVMFARGRAGRALTILHAQVRADGLQPNLFCYNAAVGTASRAVHRACRHATAAAGGSLFAPPAGKEVLNCCLSCARE